MKKFIFFYSFINILMLAFMYYITLFEVTNKLTNESYLNLVSETSENKDAKDFVKFSSSRLEILDDIETKDFKIQIIHSESISNDSEIHQLGFFLFPISNVVHSNDLNDPNDQTNLVIIDTDNEVFYDASRENEYKDISVSFGIEKIGFYFYTILFDIEKKLTFYLHDYNNELIFSNKLEINTSFNESDVIEGFTLQRIEELLNIESNFREEIIKRVTVFLISSFVVGLGIAFIIKKIKRARV